MRRLSWGPGLLIPHGYASPLWCWQWPKLTRFMRRQRRSICGCGEQAVLEAEQCSLCPRKQAGLHNGGREACICKREGSMSECEQVEQWGSVVVWWCGGVNTGIAMRVDMGAGTASAIALIQAQILYTKPRIFRLSLWQNDGTQNGLDPINLQSARLIWR